MAHETLKQRPNFIPSDAVDEHIIKRRRGCEMKTKYDLNGKVVGGCDDCYMFRRSNSPRKKQPARMMPEVTKAVGGRIGEHARDHRLAYVRVIMHGGEPLLGEAEEIKEFSSILQKEIESLSPGTEQHFSTQTNGLSLNPDKIAILKYYSYRVGLSIDGGRTANDRHRRDAQNNSTYDRALRAAKQLRESDIPWGVDAVIDTRNDALDVLGELSDLEPQSISLLLPHANHSLPPRNNLDTYGKWLITAFDWYMDRPRTIAMPIFDSYVTVLLGGKSTHESVANRKTQELFYSTGGDYQHLDVLRTTEIGALGTNMNVAHHSIDEVIARDSGIRARRLGDTALCQKCLDCRFKAPCGGGYYPHRYEEGELPISPDDPVEAIAKLFRNPTIYCGAQLELLGHIEKRVGNRLNLPEGALLRMLAK